MGGMFIVTERRISPYKLILISSSMLLILLIVLGIFIYSLEKNHLVEGAIVELFENDPKVQREMSGGEARASSKEFANEVIIFAKEILVYPFYMIGLAALLSLFGLFTIRINRFIAAIFLSFAGLLSLFTLLPPILLLFASNNLFKTASEN